MKRRAVIMVLVGIFLLSLTGAGILVKRVSAGAGRGVSEGVQRVALASENGERVDEVIYGKGESQNLTQESQGESVEDAIYGDPTERFTDERVKKIYDIILVSSSALADFYYSDSWKRTSKDIAEHPEKYDELYILEWKSREQLAMEAIKVYEELMRELRENPQNWREVWEKYKNFELEFRPKILNVDYDWRIKEKWFLNSEEGKRQMEANGIKLDRADVEIWKRDYEKILEKSRKETENMLRKYAKKIGIEY